MKTNKKTKANKDYDTLTHDELFRKMLELPEVAKCFVQYYIPERILSKIDINTVKDSKETFIEEDLKKSLSDVLLNVKFGSDDGYLYILFEHQSKPDHWMSFRLLKYIVNILDHHKNKHPKDKKLPPVYATVFYNGKTKYNAPLNLFELFEHPEVMQDFFTNGYNLIDLNKMDDDAMLKQDLAGIMSFVMKRSMNQHRENIIRDVKYILRHIIDSEYDDELKNIVVITILRYNNINKEELKEINNEVNHMPLAPFARELIDEGILVGIQQGITQGIVNSKILFVQNMLGDNMPLETISKYSELSREEVLDIKSNKLKIQN